MLRVCQYLASIVQYFDSSFSLLLLLCCKNRQTAVTRCNSTVIVTSASDLPVRTIRFCSVVFSVMSSLVIIHTIYGARPRLVDLALYTVTEDGDCL